MAPILANPPRRAGQGRAGRHGGRQTGRLLDQVRSVGGSWAGREVGGRRQEADKTRRRGRRDGQTRQAGRQTAVAD